MLPFRKILFPVDYSESAKRIVPFVYDAAQKHSADLLLVHAYGAEALAETNMRLADPALFDEVRGLQTERLRSYGEKYFGGTKFEPIARLGEAATAIHDVVHSHGADLVMLPTHGYGPVRKMLLGSVTAKVLHDYSGAIWTATPEALAKTELPYGSLLCAVPDANSEEAEAILRAGASLAKLYKAGLHVMHSIDTPPMTSEFDFTPYREELKAAARKFLCGLLDRLDIRAPHSILDGAPAECVRGEALRTGAGLIVTGRGHAQGAVSRLWSNLYTIVREAPCPVLSV